MRLGARQLVAAVLAAAALAYVGWLNLEVARLRREAARRVPFVTAEDFDRAMTDLRGEFTRQVRGLRETIGRLPGGGVFRRVEVPPSAERSGGGSPSSGGPGPRTGGPASPPEPPAGPAPPAGPLIPESEAPAARRFASERIVVHFRPGTLLGCSVSGVPDGAVEFLRDRTGRLLSTAPCVWKVEDEFYPEPQVTAAPDASRWKIAAGWSKLGADVGVAYEVVRLPPWSLDAVALVRTQSVGAGVARQITANATTGVALLYSAKAGEWQPWVVVGWRF